MTSLSWFSASDPDALGCGQRLLLSGRMNDCQNLEVQRIYRDVYILIFTNQKRFRNTAYANLINLLLEKGVASYCVPQ